MPTHEDVVQRYENHFPDGRVFLCRVNVECGGEFRGKSKNESPKNVERILRRLKKKKILIKTYVHRKKRH